MENFFKRAAAEVLRACVASTLLCLFAEALFAVFVRAYAPSNAVIRAVNWVIEGALCFLTAMLFVHRERALFKGMAAGALSVFLTMLVFAAVGGGMYLDGFFALKLFLCTAVSGGGAYLGVALRKE